MAMGTLFFCIFCSYALSFWFGYQFMRDDPDNYDVQTMISVRSQELFILSPFSEILCDVNHLYFRFSLAFLWGPQTLAYHQL